MRASSLQDEGARLDALCRYAILDTPPEEAFDDLARLASQICVTPIAAITLVDARRLWFKTKLGLEAAEASREASFCTHALCQRDLFVVPDACADARFAGHPLVTGEPHVRFYAGMPLLTPEGYALGTLCVLAPEPRELSEQQADALRALSRQVLALLQLRCSALEQKQAARAAADAQEALRRQAQQEITRLNAQLEHRLQRIVALRQIDSAISASHDLDHILEVVVEQVTDQLQVDAVAVLLFDPETSLLEYAVGKGFGLSIRAPFHLRLEDSIAGRTVLERRNSGMPEAAESATNLWMRRHEETIVSANIALLDEEHVRERLRRHEGFVSYYAVPLIAKGQVKGVVEVYHHTRLSCDAEWLEFLQSLAQEAAIAIDNAVLFAGLQRSNRELTLAYDATIEGWSQALDLRDKETEGHTQRVTTMSLRMAREAGLSEEELVQVRRGALLHDIGKLGVPDHILLKPGPLTEEEWAIMRKHPLYAYEWLSPISFLRTALDIPYGHHEKWDGTGYPRGLKGEQIPLTARLFAVVDVWDALRSDRPYRKAWPPNKVLEHIRSLSGTHFDPDVVQVFLQATSAKSVLQNGRTISAA